ncbi:MAG: EVE domain-containing protein [Planctomycetota bacterium]|nr:MAG: EVE domain-containing protein [Planctomycetota bacterium]
MPTVLLKSEPDDYAWDDLVRDGRATWDGVSNNAALMHLRRLCPGDAAFIYHTGAERRVVGLARVVSEPYEDPARPGLNARGEPRRAVVDIEPVAPAPTPVPLSAVKSDPRFEGFDLIRQPRLSVVPVPPAMARALRRLAGW